MREAEYRQHLGERSLAEKTREQRISALKRIERAYNVDLDAAFAEDELKRIAASFVYSTEDARSGRDNPSKINVDRGDLRTILAWYKSHLADYIKFCGGSGLINSDIGDDGEGPTAEAAEAAIQVFGLERDLQDALRLNISQLEDGLTVIDGDVERRVEAGFIDILARDSQGRVVVIELKAGVSKPEAVAQIMAYIGCIAGEENGPVRGILIAADHHPRVALAARAIPNLELKRYGYRFEFS
jgi:hypothetical protein